MQDVFSSKFANDIFQQKYAAFPGETWSQCCNRVVSNVVGDLLPVEVKNKILYYMINRKFIPGGRYLFGSGKELHAITNCFALRAEDSREGWAKLLHDSSSILMLGGGAGISYSNIRPKGSLISRTGSKASGPIPLMHMVNEVARGIISGGDRRGACYAGLSVRHSDIGEFLTLKDWSEELKKLKEADPLFPLPMEYTNISVEYDAQRLLTSQYDQEIFRRNMRQACETGEPGFTFVVDGKDLRNPCSEFVTDCSGDSCNLGTIFISRVVSREELQDIISVVVPFLMCGRLYTDSPTFEIQQTGLRNNRIGLGLGGVADWLIQRRLPYEVGDELEDWLSAYASETHYQAEVWAAYLNMAVPKATMSIAPAGSIGILAETTTSIEAVYAKAYKRRYRKEGKWFYQYVIDGAAKRWLELGIPESAIFDAGDLTFEQRLKFQAKVQDYVDMGISITCNLPKWGSAENNESQIDERCSLLMKYAPRLRGFTIYPDGARQGQPLTRVPLELAQRKEGVSFEEVGHSCLNGICGL